MRDRGSVPRPARGVTGRLPAVGILVAIVCVFVCGCAVFAGGEGDAGEAGEIDEDPVVHMTDQLRFIPAEVTIEQGGTVVWKNTSALVHTVTADPELAVSKKDVHLPEGAQPFNSGSIAPGDTYSHAFTVPGTYRYFCIPHEVMGMVGEVVVKPAGRRQ